MQSNNEIIIAAAGSGKTTELVKKALSIKGKKVLITTYTNENLAQIEQFIYNENKIIPNNIEVLSWYTFLLQECVRPYQKRMEIYKRISGIAWTENFRPRKEQYITMYNNIYRDKISEFVFKCNTKTQGCVIDRLSSIYEYIMIDEFQDLAGYDLNLLDMFFDSSINITLVGDPRQATFSTNNAGKNRQFRKGNILNWIKEIQKKKGIDLIGKSECYRCNQTICDFADSLFPDFPKTTSHNLEVTEHDGIFYIEQKDVSKYIEQYNPEILRYDKKTNTLGLNAKNIGLSKGRTFDHVLIFPTQNMLKFLKTKNLEDVGDKNKLYIAVTRAKYSVAFVKPPE
jgi:superfamily I DNA/RNA helicase